MDNKEKNATGMTSPFASPEIDPISSKETGAASGALFQRVNLYCLAAGAAGVGALALAQPCEAEIVFTPANQMIVNGQTYGLDLNHDGIVDFELIVSGDHANTSTLFDDMLVNPAAGNAVQGGIIYGQLFAGALLAGNKIPGGAFYKGNGLFMASVFEDPGGSSGRGHWINVTNHYLGLKFQINGQTHYGWARLSVKATLGPQININAALTGYAYETVPNQSIRAGQTSGLADRGTTGAESASASGPALQSLSALALGAPGLSIWRREEPAS
jgi:hypothetical protein